MNGQSQQQYSNNSNMSSTTNTTGGSALNNTMGGFTNNNQPNPNNSNNTQPNPNNSNNSNNSNNNQPTHNNNQPNHNNNQPNHNNNQPNHTNSTPSSTPNNPNSNNTNNTNANTANANNGDNKSILQQVAAQEKRIAELSKTLGDRNQSLAKFQTEKKTEMEALMSGMRQWIQNLDVKNEGHKEEFEKGLQRLVDTSSFDNGVWQVMVSASACAARKETDYQALKNQFEELNQQKSGGVFSNVDERVGGKRSADGEPQQDSGAVPDMWSSFIADVATSGYPMY
jgi:cell division septum initiation protein DivIVA